MKVNGLSVVAALLFSTVGQSSSPLQSKEEDVSSVSQEALGLRRGVCKSMSGIVASSEYFIAHQLYLGACFLDYLNLQKVSNSFWLQYESLLLPSRDYATLIEDIKALFKSIDTDKNKSDIYRSMLVPAYDLDSDDGESPLDMLFNWPQQNYLHDQPLTSSEFAEWSQLCMTVLDEIEQVLNDDGYGLTIDKFDAKYSTKVGWKGNKRVLYARSYVESLLLGTASIILKHYRILPSYQALAIRLMDLRVSNNNFRELNRESFIGGCHPTDKGGYVDCALKVLEDSVLRKFWQQLFQEKVGYTF